MDSTAAKRFQDDKTSEKRSALSGRLSFTTFFQMQSVPQNKSQQQQRNS